MIGSKNSKKPKIIATLDKEDLTNLYKYDLSGVDYLEIRLDLLPKKFIKAGLSDAVRETEKKVIVTYRKLSDSNQSTHSELSFSDAAEFIHEYHSTENFIDVEMNYSESIFDELEDQSYTVIYSYHNFQKTIALPKMQELMQNTNFNSSNVYKFAVTPKNADELYDFYNSIKTLSRQHRMIGIAMGEIGLIGRVFPDKFGSEFTYCCLSKPKAPGQISVENYYNLRKIETL